MQVSKGAAARIEELIGDTVEAMGFELVRVRLFGAAENKTLQIMAERPDGSMDVDDCAELSRTVATVLDIEDPIASEYVLEISSPGIDRPLTRPKDFANWQGYEARVDMNQNIDGRKRFRGLLLGLDGDAVLIRCEDEEFRLPVETVGEAKLVLTDELIQQSLKEPKPQEGL